MAEVYAWVKRQSQNNHPFKISSYTTLSNASKSMSYNVLYTQFRVVVSMFSYWPQNFQPTHARSTHLSTDTIAAVKMAKCETWETVEQERDRGQNIYMAE